MQNPGSKHFNPRSRAGSDSKHPQISAKKISYLHKFAMF